MLAALFALWINPALSDVPTQSFVPVLSYNSERAEEAAYAYGRALILDELCPVWTIDSRFAAGVLAGNGTSVAKINGNIFLLRRAKDAAEETGALAPLDPDERREWSCDMAEASFGPEGQSVPGMMVRP